MILMYLKFCNQKSIRDIRENKTNWIFRYYKILDFSNKIKQNHQNVFRLLYRSLIM